MTSAFLIVKLCRTGIETNKYTITVVELLTFTGRGLIGKSVCIELYQEMPVQ